MRDRCDLQSIHANFRIVNFHLGEACIYHELNTVQSQRCLSYVCCNNTLAVAARFKNLCLNVRAELAVDWKYEHCWRIFELFQSFSDQNASCLDVFLPSHEDENVACSVFEVDRQSLLDRSLNVIIEKRFAKVNVNLESASRNMEDRCASEKI